MNLLIVIYGIISIAIGIGPAIGMAIWLFGKTTANWGSWALGGIFWYLALLSRLPLLGLIASNPLLSQFYLILAPLFAGIFETAFRVLLIVLLPKYTANTKDKVIMAGLGWGTIEAIMLHSIQIAAILIFPSQFEEIIALLENMEWVILFGGYERLITQIFHLMVMILVFYGVKNNLRGIEPSEPLVKNFFTRDPNPKWIWASIAVIIHFLYDYIIILLLYTMGLIILYMFATVFVGLLTSYTTNRMKYYPLFLLEPTEKKKLKV